MKDENDKIIVQIEKLIDKINYTSSSLTITTKEKTITIEKTKPEKKLSMGFIKESKA